MHRFTVDYSKDRPDPRVLMNRGFFLHGLPRLIAVCRTFGHRPVIDGYDSKYGQGEERRARWVICGRCGIRPEPQGRLDPDQWQLGQPYTGPLTGRPFPKQAARQLAKRGIVYQPPTTPGAWPANPDSAIGAQVILGRSSLLNVGFKVGSNSSEQCLAANLSLGRLGAIYVHTEDHGRFLQRLLNGGKRLSTESRQTGISLDHGRLSWSLWANRDSHSKDDPKWMRGSIHIDPRHHLLGPVRNRKVSETDKVPAVVRMPEGDTHDVTVQLEQWETRRTRGRARTYWMAEWDCKAGIPVRNHDWKGDETFSCSWAIEGVTPDNPRWPHIIAAAAAEDCSRDRARYNYRAPETAQESA
jgi:hypothetical protein